MVLTKELVINLTEILAVGSVTAAGFIIGGPIGASVMAGIGINLATNIVHGGASKLKEHWLTNSNGILNHDIQHALLRAYKKALASLSEKYLKLSEQTLQEDERETDSAIREFFRELTERAENSFLPSLSEAVKEQEVRNYLYDNTIVAVNLLWDRIGAEKLLHGYNQHFKNFLRENLLKEVQFCFAEELKTDSRECNKAWRAFQRMLLEGIQADVQRLQTNQEIIQQKLQLLDVVKNQLDQLRTSLELRSSNEPFQHDIESVIEKLRKELVESLKRLEKKIDKVDETTLRSEVKLDVIAVDVKTLLASGTSPELPELPLEVQKLVDEGWEYRETGKYEAARSVFQKALKLATGMQHNLAIAKAKYCLAVVLNEWDRKPISAKQLLEEGLQAFKNQKSEIDIATTLYQMGAIEIDLGNLDQAEAFLSQALELDKKHGHKQCIAHSLHQLGWIQDHRGHFPQALEFYDQALNYYLNIYHERNPKTEKDAARGVASCYHHKGLVYRHGGKVEETETNFKQALEWYRKFSFNPDLAKILFLLSELKYREAEYEDGARFLDEALSLYRQMEDYGWCGKCYDLRARVLFTLGDTHAADETLHLALDAAEKAKDAKQQEEYLNKLGHLSLDRDQVDEAKRYFERARVLCLREKLLDGYATSVKNLAEISHAKKDRKERNDLLSDGIKTLEKLLPSVQTKPRRAYIIGQIGFFYEGMEQFEQALLHYQRAKKAFEEFTGHAFGVSVR